MLLSPTFEKKQLQHLPTKIARDFPPHHSYSYFNLVNHNSLKATHQQRNPGFSYFVEMPLRGQNYPRDHQYS